MLLAATVLDDPRGRVDHGWATGAQAADWASILDVQTRAQAETASGVPFSLPGGDGRHRVPRLRSFVDEIPAAHKDIDVKGD